MKRVALFVLSNPALFIVIGAVTLFIGLVTEASLLVAETSLHFKLPPQAWCALLYCSLPLWFGITILLIRKQFITVGGIGETLIKLSADNTVAEVASAPSTALLHATLWGDERKNLIIRFDEYSGVHCREVTLNRQITETKDSVSTWVNIVFVITLKTRFTKDDWQDVLNKCYVPRMSFSLLEVFSDKVCALLSEHEDENIKDVGLMRIESNNVDALKSKILTRIEKDVAELFALSIVDAFTVNIGNPNTQIGLKFSKH